MTLTLFSQSIHPLLIASQDVILPLQTSSHEDPHPTSPTHIAQRREHPPTHHHSFVLHIGFLQLAYPL